MPVAKYTGTDVLEATTNQVVALMTAAMHAAPAFNTVPRASFKPETPRPVL